ncbi:MAG: cupin domain-containing protein [Alphaproteobacteria bacterium]|nr:cupin domain-containing protein [Alphaproteobacteria bacterium]
MSDRLVAIREAERPVVELRNGAEYRAILGDDTGAGVPVRTGIQTSAPGYSTPVHSHPYAEILTVLDGTGEVWLEGDDNRVGLEPGVTVIVPAGRLHGFRVIGDRPLVTFGIHASGKRIVDYRD